MVAEPSLQLHASLLPTRRIKECNPKGFFCGYQQAALINVFHTAAGLRQLILELSTSSS